MSEHRYYARTARLYSLCPWCPRDIEPGDAIVLRPGDDDECHEACAYEQDELEANPSGAVAHEYARFRSLYHPTRRRKRKERRGKVAA